MQQSLRSHFELVVLLVHVVQSLLQLLDLLVVDVLDVADLLRLVLLHGLDLVRQLVVLVLQLANAVDVAGQPE